jgi:carotenoid cleavage dioxygenase-like enzyme
MNIALKQQLPHKTRTLPGCELPGYETLFEEFSYWIEADQIVVEIPSDLEGTLFFNGPGRNRIGDQQYGHWFDGDGMIVG